MSACTIGEYPDNGTCHTCSEACKDGCNGPQSSLSIDGCYKCDSALVEYETFNIIECISSRELESKCQNGLIVRTPLEKLSNRVEHAKVCQKCHDECKKCDERKCLECKNFSSTVTNECVRNCSIDEYPVNKVLNVFF